MTKKEFVSRLFNNETLIRKLYEFQDEYCELVDLLETIVDEVELEGMLPPPKELEYVTDRIIYYYSNHDYGFMEYLKTGYDIHVDLWETEDEEE